MDISEKGYINLVIMLHCIHLMLHCIHLKVVTGFNFANNYCISFFGCRICVKANSVDPDKMPHFAAFHQGPHCLKKILANQNFDSKWILPI